MKSKSNDTRYSKLHTLTGKEYEKLEEIPRIPDFRVSKNKDWRTSGSDRISFEILGWLPFTTSTPWSPAAKNELPRNIFNISWSWQDSKEPIETTTKKEKRKDSEKVTDP